MVEDILQISDVGLNDDFFEIGGDSIKATEFIAAIETEYKVKIGFEIFEKSKISEIIEIIEKKRREEEEMSIENVELIKKGESRNTRSTSG